MSIRRPAVAGQFYPADPVKLRGLVARYLGETDVAPATCDVSVVMAPHAGYVYSGATAGHAFARVRGKRPRRVVLLGPSHHFHFDGPAILAAGSFDSPLGPVAIDSDFSQQLVERFGNHDPEAHAPEHALEVELPFLQTALAADFTIVPILFGSRPTPRHRELAEHLAEFLDPDDLIVASTDLSHFLTEDEANRIDRHALDVVLTGDPEQLATGLRDGSCSLCGGTAVVVALAAANLFAANARTEWDYRTSAWATGDRSRVVGYGALTFERAN